MNKNLLNISVVTTIIVLLLALLAYMQGGIIGYVTISFSATVNNPPVLYPIPNLNVTLGNNFFYDVNATDLDNHELIYSSSSSLYPINNLTGIINFTANASHGGSYIIKITVRDELNDEDSAYVTFTAIGEYCGNAVCHATESCSSCPQDCGGCQVIVRGQSTGGGSSGVISYGVERTVFTLDNDILEAKLKLGDTSAQQIRIKNKDFRAIDIEIDISDVDEFVSVDTSEFTLNKSNSMNIEFILAPLDKEPGIYTGRIKIISGTISADVFVIVVIEEEKPLFEIDLSSINGLNNMEAGDIINVDISTSNEINTDVDIEFSYLIKDMDGNVILSKEDSVTIDKRTGLEYKINISDDIELGNYIIFTKIIYNDNIITSSDILTVKDTEEEETQIFKAPINRLPLILGIASVISLLALGIVFTPSLRYAYVLSNLAKTKEYFKRYNIPKARQHYVKMRNAYKKLPKRKKKKVFKECVETYNLLNNL